MRLSDIIASAFWALWRDIKAHKHTHYWLKGGRNSTKSSFVAIAIILLMMRNPEANAYVFRKVANTLADSVYEQLEWATEALKVHHLFRFTKSPLRITYKPTGQQIRFRGVEDPKRVRSQKFKRGYCAILWFEEAAEFGSYQELQDLIATFCRGGSRFWIFCTYNPPMSVRNWVNKEAKRIEAEGGRTDRVVHHSTYLDVVGEHPDWIGEQSVIEAERLRERNYEAYQHMWLGVVIGTGAEVFPDTLLDVRRIEPEELAALDTFSIGVDAGSAHPWVFERVGYDVDERVLYIFEEESRRGSEAHDTKTAGVIIGHLDAAGDLNAEVWCDSAARGMILYYQDQGINALKAYKQGLNSPKERVAWFRNLTRIVIDPDGAPMAAAQFPGYEYVQNKQGDITEILPKVDDDAIDAVGYAASEWIRARY